MGGTLILRAVGEATVVGLRGGGARAVRCPWLPCALCVWGGSREREREGVSCEKNTGEQTTIHNTQHTHKHSFTHTHGAHTGCVEGVEGWQRRRHEGEKRNKMGGGNEGRGWAGVVVARRGNTRPRTARPVLPYFMIGWGASRGKYTAGGACALSPSIVLRCTRKKRKDGWMDAMGMGNDER